MTARAWKTTEGPIRKNQAFSLLPEMKLAHSSNAFPLTYAALRNGQTASLAPLSTFAFVVTLVTGN